MIHGTGIDIVEISRIKQAIDRWGDDFISKIFNPQEIKYARLHTKNSYQHFAARFAVKEAVFKAIGDEKVTWKDLTVTNDKNGKPSCRFNNKKFKKKIFISISHSKHYAVASAIVSS